MKQKYETPAMIWTKIVVEDIIRTSTKNELEPDWNL